jgi:sucrose phosphorylase
VLSQWAAGLTLPSNQVTFFNFLASHDGIGVNPARGILPQSDIDALVQQVVDHGGLISYKNNPDGSQSPYEMNINYFDALSDPKDSEPIDLQVDRFMAAQAIMLTVIGMPGIYFHSLFGSRGWPEGVQQTGRNRTINRQKLTREQLDGELANIGSLRHKVFSRYQALLKARSASVAFDPFGQQQVLHVDSSVFAVQRTSPDGAHKVICLQNISSEAIEISLTNLPELMSSPTDLITNTSIDVSPVLTIAPYQTLWLKIS